MIRQPFSHDPSLTAAFAPLREVPPVFSDDAQFSAVVIGGGTGAPVSIRTLLSMGCATDAVVAMADDGGSTGILREESDVTPPGDVRKCIAAMAANPDDPLTKAFKYRFSFARNHTLGNLMLSALEDATGSFPHAISVCEQLLQARGKVYPSTLDRVSLIAHTRDGHVLQGQAVACHSRSALDWVRLQASHDIVAYQPALDAIKNADLIVFGPGSLFTSIMPNLLVPGVIDAVKKSHGRVLFVCSLADVQGETWGLTAKEHIEALIDHGLKGLIDYVLVHSAHPLCPSSKGNQRLAQRQSLAHLSSFSGAKVSPQGVGDVRAVPINYEDICDLESQGMVVLVHNLVDPTRPTWHDPLALREAFREVLGLCRLQQR